MVEVFTTEHFDQWLRKPRIGKEGCASWPGSTVSHTATRAMRSRSGVGFRHH
jgi:hypothetical protein